VIAYTIICPGVVLQSRYRVIRQIGSGGFGQVFEVDDNGTLKVLKVLSLERFSSPTIKNKAIALFRREAELLSRLNHPGIPCVEQEGYFTWSNDGNEPLHCLVMEKIPGSNLQEWLQAQGNQPITTEEACQWLTQLLTILDELHQHQYFHRDIKPSNCMIRPNGQLVLIDFGAVREVTTSYLQKQRGNETGTVLISPGYTPSEQAEGHAVPQSDFFALGRSFVYLLTGKSPLEFPKDPQTGELIWHDQAPLVSPQLADLIDRLMAPFPGQRPQNCQEILQYLAEIQRNSLLSKLVQTLPGISRLFVRRKRAKDSLRHKRSLQLILAGLFLLGGGSVWKLSPNIAKELNDQGYAHYQRGELNTAWLYYQFALIAKPNKPETEYNLGVLYEDQNKTDQAHAVYEIAVQGGLAKADNNLARLYIKDKQFAAAVTLLQKALPLAKDDKTKYAMLKNLAWAQLGLGHYQEAETNLHKAINIQGDRAAAYCLEALLLKSKGNKQASLAPGKNCLEYAKKDNDPDLQELMRSITLVLPSLRIEKNQG